MKSYNAYQLKLAMAGLMVFDHLHIVPGLLSSEWVGIFHLLTRCVGVFFAYMLVEGFMYTRNVTSYLVRLWAAAGMMAAGNSLLHFLYQAKEIHISNNIFLTLAVGLTVLLCLKDIGQQTRGGRIGLIVLATLLTLFGIGQTEGGMVILPFILITYLGRNATKKRTIAYLLFSLLLFFLSYQSYETWEMTLLMLVHNSDWFFISVLPILGLYNGESGPRTTFSRYFFYLFYPAHIWLLATLTYFL